LGGVSQLEGHFFQQGFVGGEAGVCFQED